MGLNQISGFFNNLLKQGIVEFIEDVLYKTSLTRIILAIFVIVLTFALRKLFVKVIIALLQRLTKKTKTEWDDRLLEAIDPPARLLIIAFGIYLAGKVLGLELEATSFLNKAVRTINIYCIFWSLFRASDIISSFLERVVKKTESTLDDIMLPFVNKGIKVVIIILAITVIAREWNYNIETLIAGLGIGGLAFALAAQDTVANLFGGVTIMVDKPFNIGDWIKTPQVEGTVEDIGFRSTRVRTFDQALVTISNSTLINTAVINWSRMGKRRLKFQLGVKYSTTSSELKECVKRIRDMLNSHPEIHKDTVFVYFEGFGSSSLEIFLYFFTTTTNWQKFLEVQEDVKLKIMDILEQLNIEIAFPSTSVYIETDTEITDFSKEKIV